MFNTEILLSTFIYITIFCLFFLQVLFSNYKDRGKKFKIRLLLLVLCTIIYNVVEGILPDLRLPIDLFSQDIIVYSVGIIVAFYTFHYLNTEFDINIIRPLSIPIIAYIVSISFIILFTIPYSLTKNLDFSRKIFLGVPLLPLILTIFYTTYIQFKKIRYSYNHRLKLHILCGITGLMGVASLPITILIFGDNQLLEHSCYTLGVFFIYIDSLFSNPKQKIILNDIFLDILTNREKEILKLVLLNPDKKYLEISEKLYISEKTLTSHMSNIFKKFQVKSKKELIKKINTKR